MTTPRTIDGLTEKVRFPAPVPVGSRVRAGVELLEVTPGGGRHQVVTRITIEREGGDKPVCVADTVTVVVPWRPRGAEPRSATSRASI